MEESMTTEYHQPEVIRVTPFSGEGAGLAAVTLCYGPITINAKLFRNKEGSYFLGMPARKSQDERWYNTCEIEDRSLMRIYETLAIRSYEEAMLSRAA
jgi:hypothetical protein